ncbi:hypothetical protein pipiens_017339 [Culex pipiens pipiens]|uniref:Uncharacterized protein n=1 Tax=Culex pipiens pipiens TaxID=38569 RepID=A0ABD1CHC0_CULPP
MSQRKKILYGLFGIIIGLCVGALFRNYRTLEIVSMCNSINSMKQKNTLTTDVESSDIDPPVLQKICMD